MNKLLLPPNTHQHIYEKNRGFKMKIYLYKRNVPPVNGMGLKVPIMLL